MKGASILNHSMFRKKSVEYKEDVSGTPALRRVLRPLDLVMLGIGRIIRTGCPVRRCCRFPCRKRPAAFFYYCRIGLPLCSSLLCRIFYHDTGSRRCLYLQLHGTGGDLGLVTGRTFMLEYGLAISAVAIDWSAYMTALVSAFGISLPAYLFIRQVLMGVIVIWPRNAD